MIHHFDHRFGDYRDMPPTSQSTALPEVPVNRLQNPQYTPLPRYWVPESEVTSCLEGKWNHPWFLGWRDICRSTDQRTVIGSVVPRAGVGDKFLLMLPSENPKQIMCLLGNLVAFIFDYTSRQKVGGTSLKYFTMKQLPILPPAFYSKSTPWSLVETLHSWLYHRILELTYTASDLEPFAKDCGYDGPPFCWDEERRFLLRCELDAAFFHLYGIAHSDVDYIMETFHIIKRKDEAQFGEYRTKRLILDIYNDMQQSIITGEPYRTRLDPPPADPRIAHEAKEISTHPS
jgi:hypothetical protein